MSESDSASSVGPITPRNRGRACLHCRRRKMRCDGAKPACFQCQRADRASECAYDGGEAKTTYQLLYDKLHRLESRLKELQGPKRPAQIRTDKLPSQDQGMRSPMSVSLKSPQSMKSPQCFPMGNGAVFDPFAMQYPFMPGAGTTDLGSVYLLDPTLDLSVLPVGIDPLLSPVWAASNPTDPPLALSHFLLNAFLPHAQQCGLSVHLDRFVASMTMSLPGLGPHPALKNVVWLWGCHFSGDGSMDAHRATFLRRTLDALDDLLQHADGLLAAVQTTCLLATYLFAHARMAEGAYHANAAALLAMSGGLHRLQPPGSAPRATLGPAGGPLALPPLRDGIAWAERLHAFWNVFVLERAWSAAAGFASQRWDGRELRTTITAPWPADFETYTEAFPPPEREFVPPRADPRAVSNVFNFAAGYDLSGSASHAELRAKSAALYENATRLGEIRGSVRPMTQATRDWFVKIQTTLYEFCRSLPPPGCGGGSGGACTLVAAHAMAHAAVIRLHAAAPAGESVAGRAKCVAAAHALAAGAESVAPGNFAFLEPIVASCWMLAGVVLARESARLRALPPPGDDGGVAAALDVLVFALGQLGNIFPLAAFQANKVASMR